MANEIETKVLDIDAKAVIAKLESLGAEKNQDTRLAVAWFGPKGLSHEGDDPWFLRIRSNSAGKHEVTWKAKSEIIGTARKHKEINFLVPDPAKLADLFEELALEEYAHQEKDRTSFSLKNWQFDIDQYPKMPAYMEIEGESEVSVNEAIALLGLGKNKTWAKGERILIDEVYGLDWFDMRF